MCQHVPACPSATEPDHDAARVVCTHPEQGWSLLCNGVVVFEDTGEILPDRTTVDPHRPLTRLCRAQERGRATAAPTVVQLS